MKLDGRKLSHKTREEIRIRAVQRVQAGESPEKVVKVLGFTRVCIYRWLARYRSGGWHALKARPLTGRKPKLTAQNIRWIYKAVATKDPRQMKFPFALWTRRMVAVLIKEKFGISLSETSVGRLLRQLGFTCQHPLHRAYQQNPELVEKWKKEEYPKILKQARKEGADIYFFDESGIRSDYHTGTTWALKGHTPVVKTTGARFSLNMMSAVTAQGTLRFMVVEGSVTGDQVCEFLQRLMHNSENPIYLIWDRHPVHKSRNVQKCIQSFNGKLKIFLLPPYSPELNPAEQVWNSVKNHGVAKSLVFGPDQLKSVVLSQLRRLQKLPKLISAFFKHPDCAYTIV